MRRFLFTTIGILMLLVGVASPVWALPTQTNADSVGGATGFSTDDFTISAGTVYLDYTNSTAASATDNGFLSTTDWTTFNAKMDATNGTAYTPTVSGPLSLQGSAAINCATGYTLTTGTASYIRVVGLGGAVTGVNLADGTVDGQLLTVQGTSDTNVVCITQGSNCVMADGTPYTARDGGSISFRWDGTASKWREQSATGVPRGLKTYQCTAPADAYDVTPAVLFFSIDSTMPHGVIITEWYVSSSADDPATELDANLVKWTTPTAGEGWPQAMTNLATLDTTAGNASATGLTIDVANGQTIGLDYDADPTDANIYTQIRLIYYYQN